METKPELVLAPRRAPTIPGATSLVPQKGAALEMQVFLPLNHFTHLKFNATRGGEIIINRENVNFTVKRAKAALKNVDSAPDPVTGSGRGSCTSHCTHLLPSPAVPEDNNSFPTIQVAPEPHLLHVCKLLGSLSLKHRVQ